MLPTRITHVSLVRTASPSVAAEAANHSNRSVRTNRASIQKAKVTARTAGPSSRSCRVTTTWYGIRARMSAPSTPVFDPYSSRPTRNTAKRVATPRNATTIRPRRSGVPELNSGDKKRRQQ